MSNHSSPFPSCFRRTSAPASVQPPPSPPPATTTSGNPNLTTCLYQTEIGLFSLTWSRTFLAGHSLRLHLLPTDAGGGFSPLSLSNPPSLSSLSFHLHIKPFTFWKKSGSKRLNFKNQESDFVPRIQIFWDLSKAKFGSGPEPESGFFVAVVVDREIVFLVGDLTRQALSKSRARKPEKNQAIVLRRECIYGDRAFATKARFGGKTRDVAIDCTTNSNAKLTFSVDGKRVLSIKRLKWKFRGSEKIEFDGVPIHISWDVYNWLFEDPDNGHAIFVFRFEDSEEDERETFSDGHLEAKSDAIVPWQQTSSCSGFSINGLEWRKMRRSLMRTTRSSSSSSISMSSASSFGGSSSIMEWNSIEENELSAPNGFALVVYAWRK